MRVDVCSVTVTGATDGAASQDDPPFPGQAGRLTPASHSQSGADMLPVLAGLPVTYRSRQG